ncbi:MAG: secondary thiamine-phosphate synthase enzyme YjbQ [Aigarchaeota archaeon]|nr:secondary thiamine-phosphate synthase enzyme YjbQ [Candidatus Calditenuaceae archaeon]
MSTYTGEIVVRTRGENDVIDITDKVEGHISRSEIRDGVAHLYVVGSTAALTTIEHEPGLIEDLRTAMERIAPKNAYYKHHERWGDDNGHSHIRASIIGPSLCIPVRGRQLVTGTWQQVVLVELDTRARERRIIVTVLGD